MKNCLQILGTIVLGAQSVIGATIYVSPAGSHTEPYNTWTRAATSVVAAINFASDGNIVVVDDGQYVLDQTINIDKGIILRSRNGHEFTELNGNNSVRCLAVRHADAIVKDFTITAGNAMRGGGVLITNGLVFNCVITGNYAQLFGGGVDIDYNGRVENCLIAANRTPIDAGGLGGGACISSGGMLFNSTVSDNEAANGGGIYMFCGSLVDESTIVSNLAWDPVGLAGGGGGVAMNGTNIILRNSIVAHNLSQETGGGIYSSGHQAQKIVGCLVYDNETAWFGGGVYFNIACDPYTIESCTIVGNRATDQYLGYGGGVFAGSSGYDTYDFEDVSTNDAKRYALLVGVNHTNYDLNPLQGCANDVDIIKSKILIEDALGRWDPDNIKTMIDSQATKSAVRSYLQQLAATAEPGALVLFNQSSHGGTDAKYTYLCMFDSLYRDYELAADLALFDTDVNIVLLIDACHSGGLFRQKNGRPYWSFADKVVENYKNIKSAQLRSAGLPIPRNLGENIAFMTAANFDEKCKEGVFRRTIFGMIYAFLYEAYDFITDSETPAHIKNSELTYYGFFTYFMAQAATDIRADFNGDGEFQFMELFNYASPRASARNPDQNAQTWNDDLLRSISARAVPPALSFRNSIIYFNTAGKEGDNHHCDDGGMPSGINVCTIPVLRGIGNISANPRFRDLAGGDFRLASGSPCINAGMNMEWMTSARDIDLKPRIINSITDIGAYEFGSYNPNEIILNIIRPDTSQFDICDSIKFSMRARQLAGPGITQTVVAANGNIINQQSWNNAEYCLIEFTWTNRSPGDFEVTLSAWDADGNTESKTVDLNVITVFSTYFAADFDGDGLADPAAVDALGGFWVRLSRSQYAEWDGPHTFGQGGWIPLAADFDGDGMPDIVMVDEDAKWHIWRSGDNYAYGGFRRFGQPGWTPLAADFDGDGMPDIAMVDQAAEWHVWLSGNNYAYFGCRKFGEPGWIPLAADFDGDGKADPCMISDESWHLWPSSNNYNHQGPYFGRIH